MKKKGRNHLVWILAIAAAWLIFDYFYYGSLSTSNFVKALVMAVVLEVIGYNMNEYRKDYEKEKTN